MGQKLVLIGAGGFARETLDLIEAIGQDSSAPEMLGYIVDQEFGAPGTLVNGQPILGGFEWLEKHASQVSVVCAIGSPSARFRLARRAQQLGCRFMSLIHPGAMLTRWVTRGDGVIITAGCVLTNRITLGDHAQLNLGCTIGHDVVIHPYATLAPGVHVSGNVTLGTGCYVGTGANLIQNIAVGEWSIIGAGSAIIKDVPPNSTSVGVPGKVIKTRPAGWHLAPDGKGAP